MFSRSAPRCSRNRPMPSAPRPGKWSGTSCCLIPRSGRRRRKMLHFLMTHPERVYSRAQLLDEIWGDHVFVEERTVDGHIRRLRQALEPTEHDSLVETVRGTGYRFRRTLT